MRQLSLYSAALCALVLGGQAAWAEPPVLEVSPDVYKALKFMELRARTVAPGEKEIKALRNKILADNLVSEDEQRVIDQFRSDRANFTYQMIGADGNVMSSTLNVTVSPEVTALLDTIVGGEALSDLEILWRRNDGDAWSGIVGISTQSEAEKNRVQAFLADKLYAAWLEKLKSDDAWSDSGAFKNALMRIHKSISILSGDEFVQGRALFRDSVLMTAKMANDDNDGHAIPPFMYQDLISDAPAYSEDEEYQ